MLTSGGCSRSSASVCLSSSSRGSGLVGAGCCHTMASWACSLRYRLVRCVRLTLLTTFLGERKLAHHPSSISQPMPTDPAGLHCQLTSLGQSHGRSLPTAACTRGAAAQKGALAALGPQERILLVLELQQFGSYLLITTDI